MATDSPEPVGEEGVEPRARRVPQVASGFVVPSWALGRLTTACFVAGILLLIAACAITYHALSSFAATSAHVAQSHQVQAELGHLQRAVIDASAARRAYTTDREERHVAAYRAAAIRAGEILKTLRRLTADNPRQQADVGELDRLLGWHIERAVNPDAAPRNSPPAGENTSQLLLVILGRMNAEEEALLRQREQQSQRNFVRATRVVPAGTAGGALFLLLALFMLNRETAARKKTQAALLESGQRYQLLFESSPLPMWVYDLETCRFLAVNDAATFHYGYSREEFLAMTIKDIRPPEDLPALRQDMANTPPTSIYRSPRIWTHRKKDRTIIQVEITSHDVTLDGRMGRLVLANDVTARLRAETELRASEAQIRQLNDELEKRIQQRTAQLEAANKELESFSYSVSHDLRAPLRHVQGYVAMLERTTAGQLSEKALRCLKVIDNAGKEMGELIDDLLEFSRMGRSEMQESRVPLDELVQDTLRRMETATRGRNIAWKIAPLPVVTGDASMLRQVLLNLIGNAIKYTRQRDPAEIEIGCAGDENNYTVFFVRDNGAGFDMQYAHKLFGVFQRLHRSDEFEGTGIGLATVRRVITRHGGRVWAEGALGQGATFYFTLQRAIDQPTKPVINVS